VVLPQSVLTAQSRSLLQAWNYSSKDHLLHVLPLHHIHGTVNALLAPLYAGSTIEFLFPFNATQVWQRFAAPFLSEPTAINSHISSSPNATFSTTAKTPALQNPITFFTAVPTIYQRLLSSFPTLPPHLQSPARTATHPSNLRLNISGSAALPTPLKTAWAQLANGNVLLERYGMTEIGMALSCGLDFRDRVDGAVGWALPGVEVRLMDIETGDVIGVEDDVDGCGRERVGEIQVRGPTVFKRYWRNETATAEGFIDGWFKTGDVAVRRLVEGAGETKGHGRDWCQGPVYFILGRMSADIIKTGGEKVSALEVERELLSLPEICECAVVGLKSEVWGQKVAAVVVLSEVGKTAGKGGKSWGAMDMRRSLRDKLANYKIPQEIKIVNGLMRNAMGKGELWNPSFFFHSWRGSFEKSCADV
jgi:acyl-CoA synthetase (AMP-forming)/AMP-acid ligase II